MCPESMPLETLPLTASGLTKTRDIFQTGLTAKDGGSFAGKFRKSFMNNDTKTKNVRCPLSTTTNRDYHIYRLKVRLELPYGHY